MRPRYGFVRRVVLVGLTSAVFGALVAAVVAIATVDWLLAKQADHRLMGAVIELAGELDEDSADRRPSTLEGELRDENDELAPSGISLSVFKGKERIAGAGPKRTPDVGDCETQGMLGARMRSCSIPYGDWVLVASQRSDRSRLRWLYLLAALGACATGAVAGGLSGHIVARWAIEPLRAMTDQLRVLEPGRDTKLGEPSDCRELEAVRSGIEELLSRIQRLLAQAEHFAADAAHELRNPMAALSVELELLAETLAGTERESVLKAHQRVLGLSTLVERLLVSALPTENLRRGFETVALEDVVLDVLGKGSAALKAKTTFAAGPEGVVRGDPQLLGSLVQNAIDNAHKYGGDGVVVRLTEDAAWVRLEVEDQGPGVSPELRDRVFEPFFRIPGNPSAGHGLGLALIGQVARAHGGDARFEDCERGARLVITLPAWTETAAMVEADTADDRSK